MNGERKEQTHIRMNIPDTYEDEILQEFSLLGDAIDEGYDGIYALHIENTQHVVEIENILDRWRVRVPEIRYHIFIYENNKEWPRSIRINRLGKKIITTRQTKFGPLR